ncbi:hypothetical protein SUBVAR_07108 [Subdoligranulum variabile DSM 15176]|uniref:Uncharacterized protein n=1 Tax=Subdoligranulum variabile DSM 15176 TaxID=411471 RepID=D1PRM3_9FIRM|nr:hypothetical protein SUBVAR_07108 [Subdoligranulum variabile DSM 15176]
MPAALTVFLIPIIYYRFFSCQYDSCFFYDKNNDGGSVPFWENASLTFSPHTPLLAEKMTG